MARTHTTTSRMETGVVAFIWRHRIGLAPLLAGSLVAIISSILKFTGLSETTAYVVIGTLTIVWFVTDFRMEYESGELGKKAKFYKRFNLWYMAAIVGAAAGWMVWWYRTPTTWASTEMAFTVWFVGIFVLGAPYWFDMRRKTRVRLDTMMEAWPGLVESTTLAKSRLVGFTKTANGWTGILTWEKGALSRRRVKDEADLVESLTDAPAGSVVIETLEGKGNVNKVKVTCVEDDPHTQPIEFDNVVAKSIKDPVNLGRYIDHQEEKSRWWEDGVGGFHRLLAGATRTGKSGLTHLLVAKYGPAKDVALWLADLKGGTALLPWSPMADWTVTTAEDAVHMLQAGAKEVDRRAQVCASRGVEVWEPSVEEPVILLFFDEIASCIGDSAPNAVAQPARQAIVEIARKGAGMGVLVVPATQYPTLAALGDSQLKSQLSWRACFRLNQPEQGHYILPSMPKGVDPYRIPKARRGTCYIDAEGEFRPAMLRVQFVDRSDIQNIVSNYGRRDPNDVDGPKFLDGIEDGWGSPALATAYKSRMKWSIQDLDTLKSGGSVIGSNVTEDDLHDHEDATPTDREDDDMIDSEPHFNDNVVAVDFTDHVGSELRKAVDQARQDDPQTALRDAKEREAWLAARQPVAGDKVDETIMEALREAGNDGIGPADLASKTGRSERTMHRRLEKMRDQGAVTRLAWGKYALTVQPARR